MKKHFTFFGTILFIIVLFLTGCASRDSLNRQQQTFLFEVPTNTQHEPTTVNSSLKIRFCRATAPFDGQYFLYRTEAGQYQQDYYKCFLTPPNEQISELLRVWLGQSGAFCGVLSGSSTATADYILEPQLAAMYADFSSPTEPKTALKMQFILLKVNHKNQTSTVVMDVNYESSESFTQRTALDIIKNYNSGLETIFTRLQSDIVTHLK